MSVILRLGAVNTETPYSRLVSDGTEYDAPVDMSPVADELYHSPPQTYPGCFGLPYQDHNYGAPPPPTPPQTPPPPPVVKESLDIKEEIVVTSDTATTAVTVAAQATHTYTHPQPLDLDLDPTPAPLADDNIEDPTRCICDFIHDDGYMIQCDECSVWQHIVCMGLDRDSIPDTYLCELCHPRPVDRARAREFQIRKREFLKNLLITTHDSSTDTDPEEVNNRLKAYGLEAGANNAKQKQKVKMKKRKERNSSKCNNKKMKSKEPCKEKENTSKDMNKKTKLLVKDFSSRTAQVKKEKLTKKIEKMRAERISKELQREERFSSDDLREDEKIINTVTPTVAAPIVQDENAQTNPWEINAFNEWEQSYEVAKYNQYTTYVQEYLNSTYINGHHNDIADLVTDGLRVQRCHLKELKNKMKGLQSSCTIPDGQPIIEVIGKVMTRQQYDKDNFGQRQLSPFVFFYGKVFDLDLVIDASDYGNDARFIRRSCQANAVVRHVVAGGQAHFITVATREILEGTEITIPFDYDYKKWNFCVECACLRNNCPVSRYQKRRLRFQKLQIDQTPKNFDLSPSPKIENKSPVKSPVKSPIKSPVHSPEKSRLEECQPELEPAVETPHVEPTTPSPTKMVRRSQVNRQTSNNASTQASAGRLRSLRVPSQPDSSDTEADPVTKPELSTNLRSSEVDALTSPELSKDSKGHHSDKQQDQPQEKRKLTREERKMEAIMKAFEKMEKRNARKQSMDHSKIKEKDDKDKKYIKKETDKEVVVKEEEPIVEVKVEPKIVSPKVVSPVKTPVKIEPAEPVLPPAPAVPAAPPAPVVEAVMEEPVEVKEEECKVEIKEEEKPLENPAAVKPEVKHRHPSKGKKAKKAANRRRTRNSSGAALVTPEVSLDCQEESSCSTTSNMMVTSCPVTPVAAPLEDNNSSSSATPFRFLKTKRHLMNEWLIEKSCDTRGPAARTEPLEVAVEEEESMYVTCLPSPRNSMDRLRRNSQSSHAAPRDRHTQSLESTGSAKKRWLRQAMGEGSSDNGLASPGQAAGGMSPNPQTAMPSPGGSPPTDFVTPLKKRRLARESLSRDSVSSESPTPTPTPSSSVPATSYFNMNEGFADKLENFRNRNGLSSFFTPVKSMGSSEEDLDSTEKKTVQEVVSNEAQCDVVEKQDCPESNTADLQCPGEAENRVSVTEEQDVQVDEDKDGVSSCAEMDCSGSYKTGTLAFPDGKHKLISNTEIRSSTEVVGDRTVCSEQISVCDAAKSANSEPDSSDSAGVCSETPMEVECDSGSGETATVSVVTSAEVDSTECSDPPPVIDTTNTEEAEVVQASHSQISSQNDQCDSCNSERLEDQASDSNISVASSVADKFCTSSTSLSTSSVVLEMVNSSVDVRHCKTSPSVVDSSTDKHTGEKDEHRDYVTDSTVSVSVEVPEISTLDPIPSVTSQEPVTASTSRSGISFGEHEVGLINSTIEGVPQINLECLGSSDNNGDSLIATAYSTVDTANVPNRHLRFLTDCHMNTEMVVDSTTQYMPPVLTGGLVNTSGLATVSAYDSDSMDVTSGTDLGLNGSLEDMRKSDDSMSGYPDNSTGRGLGEASIPKEKKKVSLQEYLKRKKDKPAPASTVNAATVSASAVSSSTTPVKVMSSSSIVKSPLRLSTNMKLDKLPPLPSLPSLPMFEKTERKEFKSSSDLLSPIFNRREKQEEVRKPMSLSERLRQEFGLDDSTDTDTDTDNKPDAKIGLREEEGDVPPPPPPPPPQLQGSRSSQLKVAQVANGSAIPSLMSIKTFHTPIIKATGDATSATVVPTSHSQMVPPPYSSGGKPMGGATSPSPGKSQVNSMPPSLMNLLSNVKSPAQLQNDLTTQLNALKAQISKVQQSLPNSSSTSVGSTAAPADHLPLSVNGAGASSSNKPQVFDYGHQSSANYIRQNSYPSSTSSKQHFHGFNKTSPPVNFGKTSPCFNKLSPGFSKHSPSPGGHTVPSNHSYNSHHNNMSPPAWNQKASTSHKHLPSSATSNQRKHFSKQSAHKYS